MPQVDLYYCNDLNIDTHPLFATIESTINAKDPNAGACKSRAHAISEFLHSHVMIHIAVLEKPHRDATFMNALLEAIHQNTSKLLPPGCTCCIELGFLSAYYLRT